ncbi:MAG TPA: flagellar motor protein [Steroidobacteraceae bacterium]|nr:flagellar motor protein [Steroidobacteraceae bacterium]
MDILSILGIVLAFVALLAGAVLKGAGVHALLSSAALLIVVVGTFAAILVQTPGRVLKHAFGILPWVFRSPVPDSQAIIARMVEWSQVARRLGLLGLEGMIEGERDEFIRKGLQLVIDGSEPDAIRSIMEVDLDGREAADLRAARVFEGMGVYAPTLGIIGAVLGLMAVMQHLTDPSKLGTGIAAAFTATVYGIGLANLFLLPIASKLKTAALALSRVREMVIEGMIAIAQGENPRSVEYRLQSYLH